MAMTRHTAIEYKCLTLKEAVMDLTGQVVLITGGSRGVNDLR
jgi:hypothetical protein